MINFNTYNHIPKGQKGFTLIETIIAILILVLTVGALLTLTAGGFFTIRYAKNDIVAGNLLQESLEYIRSTRDTVAYGGQTLDEWYQPYMDAGCDTDDGCIINPYATEATLRVQPCSNACDPLRFFPGPNFYSYEGDNIFGRSDPSYETSFVRTIKISHTLPDDPQLQITASIIWMNGTNQKRAQQSIVLTNWNFQ